jgi:hypothetical protein
MIDVVYFYELYPTLDSTLSISHMATKVEVPPTPDLEQGSTVNERALVPPPVLMSTEETTCCLKWIEILPVHLIFKTKKMGKEYLLIDWGEKILW